MAVQSISRDEFDALGPYRPPEIQLAIEEAEWFADADRRVIGVLARYPAGHGWSVAVLGRDEAGIFRSLSIRTSLARRADARATLLHMIEGAVATRVAPTLTPNLEHDRD